MSDDVQPESMTTDPLFSPEQWPSLQPAQTPEELASVVRRLASMPEGRTLFHSLVVNYWFSRGLDISADRQLGRQDVVIDLLEMIGLAHVVRSNGQHITGTG